MAKTLSKNDLTKSLAEKLEFLNQTQAKEAIDTFLADIAQNVANGNNVQLLGFGSFEKKHKKATTGRNPRTGAELKISARDYPKFSAGKNFKEIVNS